MLLPSLTLQLLVENAVKHNIVLTEKPLTVTIAGCGDKHLLVTNNVQKKSIRVPSNGVGLANINAKFRLLNEEEILIEATEDQFSVNIPLIRPH